MEGPLIFSINLIYKDFTFTIWSLMAILRKKGQTIIDLPSLQILEVRLKEIKLCTKWCRHLLHCGTHGPAGRQGRPTSGFLPPACISPRPQVILRHLKV